eukprot:4195328-Lingulodinium_polyedra.AAC.1
MDRPNGYCRRRAYPRADGRAGARWQNNVGLRGGIGGGTTLLETEDLQHYCHPAGCPLATGGQ